MIALGGLGCGQSPTPTPGPSSGSSIVDTFASASAREPAAPKEAPAIVAQRFDPYVVTLPHIARRTLYTWTKREQIEELKKDPTLLTRAESPEHGTSYFEQMLEERAQQKSALAKLLRSAPFAKQRYAWVAPFATRLGIGDESYGDELIRIDLKPEAWFVIMKTSSPELVVVDAENKPIALADALAHPERLAAAYFTQDKPVTGYRASMAGPNERVGYREYVLFNESMIASYSVGTPEIANELAAEIRALEGFHQSLVAESKPAKGGLGLSQWMVELCSKTWTSETAKEDPVERYDAALAFADYPYFPAEGNLKKLVENLRALQLRDQAFKHVPTVPFPSNSTNKPAPPVNTTAPKMRGTH